MTRNGHQRAFFFWTSLIKLRGIDFSLSVCKFWVKKQLFFVDNMVEDMDVDLDKEFLQELKELKILINDKDLLDQHKR